MGTFGDSLASAGASGAVGLVGSVITGAINNAYAKKQWQREVTQEQSTYERNRADYLADLENERNYNSPQQQLERMRAAGMNPNLANGGQLVSGAVSSGAQVMNNGASPSGKVFPGDSLGSIMSGVAASSNADVAQRKADEEIVSIKLSNESKAIENEFLRAEKELTIEKKQADINETFQRIKESVSRTNLNNSVIEVNGKQVQLIDKNMEKADQEIALLAAQQVVENLNAEKMRILLPYVEKQAQAELQLTKARTKQAKAAAYLSYKQAAVSVLQAAKEAQLLKAGYVDAILANLDSQTQLNFDKTGQIAADISKIQEEMKYIGMNAQSKKRASTAALIGSIGNLIKNLTGAALDIKNVLTPGSSDGASGSAGGTNEALMGLFM